MVEKLIQNREKVVWLTRLANADDAQARESLERQMVSNGLRWILDELHGVAGNEAKKPRMARTAPT